MAVRKLLVASLVFLVFLVMSCGHSQENSQEEPTIVCNAPYILVGTSCCLDKNANKICDVDEQEATPVVEEKTPPKPKHHKLSAQEKLDATNFAHKLARWWEKNDWEEIYKHIPSEEQEVISEKEFVFFMNITSVYAKASFDQEFQESIYGGVYNGFKRGDGLKIVVGDVTFDNETGKAETIMGSMTFDKVPLNTPFEYAGKDSFIVNYDFRPFTLILEDGEWKVVTIGVYFMGNDPDTICESTNYKYRCLFEYAKDFNKPDYCDKTGYYVPDCYEYFKKSVPIGKAIAGCKTQPEKPKRDECLTMLMLKKKDVQICEEMSYSQNKFICYGMAAGFDGNYEACWDRITSMGFSAIENQKVLCIYGYVWATQNRNDCSYMPKSTNNLVEKCWRLEFPFK